MTRNMVKLSTSVTLKELRSPPVSGREKLIMSARMIRMLGSISVMKGLRYLMLRETCREATPVQYIDTDVCVSCHVATVSIKHKLTNKYISISFC